jgi:hypothetical protein
VRKTEGELNDRDRGEEWQRGDFDTKCGCENIEEIVLKTSAHMENY